MSTVKAAPCSISGSRFCCRATLPATCAPTPACPQEPRLFSMSVADNISYGCPNPVSRLGACRVLRPAWGAARLFCSLLALHAGVLSAHEHSQAPGSHIAGASSPPCREPAPETPARSAIVPLLPLCWAPGRMGAWAHGHMGTWAPGHCNLTHPALPPHLRALRTHTWTPPSACP